jgi:hypothetical protein
MHCKNKGNRNSINELPYFSVESSSAWSHVLKKAGDHITLFVRKKNPGK